MSKILATLTLIVLLSVTLVEAGHSSQELKCEVSQPVPEKCTPYLVLEHANLVITAQDRFKLQGRYAACFHREDVTITGRVNRFPYYDGLDLELLATEIRFSPTKVQDFPRTIGTVTLKQDQLRGYFFDVWASIRTHGTYGQDPFSRIIHCKTERLKGETP